MQAARAGRAGVRALARDGQQLTIGGHLLSNKHGKAVAQDADDGFPWQMSVLCFSDLS
jgi:hypothetical protein